MAEGSWRSLLPWSQQSINNALSPRASGRKKRALDGLLAASRLLTKEVVNCTPDTHVSQPITPPSWTSSRAVLPASSTSVAAQRLLSLPRRVVTAWKLRQPSKAAEERQSLRGPRPLSGELSFRGEACPSVVSPRGSPSGSQDYNSSKEREAE